jgi:hypothetical protein
LLGCPSFGTIFFEREALGPRHAKPWPRMRRSSRARAGMRKCSAPMACPKWSWCCKELIPRCFTPRRGVGFFRGGLWCYSGGKLEARKGAG